MSVKQLKLNILVNICNEYLFLIVLLLLFFLFDYGYKPVLCSLSYNLSELFLLIKKNV